MIGKLPHLSPYLSSLCDLNKRSIRPRNRTKEPAVRCHFKSSSYLNAKRTHVPDSLSLAGRVNTRLKNSIRFPPLSSLFLSFRGPSMNVCTCRRRRRRQRVILSPRKLVRSRSSPARTSLGTRNFLSLSTSRAPRFQRPLSASKCPAGNGSRFFSFRTKSSLSLSRFFCARVLCRCSRPNYSARGNAAAATRGNRADPSSFFPAAFFSWLGWLVRVYAHTASFFATRCWCIYMFVHRGDDLFGRCAVGDKYVYAPGVARLLFSFLCRTRAVLS